MDALLFVENIKKYCAQKGVKPTVACKESGAGKDLINQIERRGSLPSIEKAHLIADYLGVTTSELLGETKKPTVQDDGLTEAEQALMDLFRQLTPDQQDLVIRMVQAAADKL